MTHPDQDSAGAAAPAESAGLGAQPDVGGAEQVEARADERRELLGTLDVVPAVGAGAALGARRAHN